MGFSDTERGAYILTWDSYAFGEHDGVEIEQHYKLTELKISSLGDVVIDHYHELVGGVVRLKARELPIGFYQKVSPWWSSGSIALGPSAPNTKLYQYAKLLNLHPREQGVTLTKDLNYLKAVPLWTPFARDGMAPSVQLVGFQLYLDQAQLPNRVLGYMGAPPS